MIKVWKCDVKEAEGARRVIFHLKTSRDVWISEDSLILEYPLKFEKLANLAESALFSLLPIAFFEDSDIELCHGLSLEEGTCERIKQIVELWNGWFGCRRKIKVHAAINKSKHVDSAGRAGAQLFSGGVDSLATFARRKDEVKYFILFHGADIRLTRPDRFAEVLGNVSKFAEKFGKEVIPLWTNAAYLADVSWPHVSHSSMMLGACLALSGYIKRIFIASSFSGTAGHLMPWGSHPRLDPLIRTSSTDVIHDGFELNRREKVTLISKDADLVRMARVCGANLKSGLNCGECEKCLRTTLVFSLLGIFSGEAAFPSAAFDLRWISKKMENIELHDYEKLFWCENLEFLSTVSRDIDGKHELIKTLEIVLGDFYRQYQSDFSSGLPDGLRYESKWRLLEKKMKLPPDSLKIIKKIMHYMRGKGYEHFVETRRRYK